MIKIQTEIYVFDETNLTKKFYSEIISNLKVDSGFSLFLIDNKLNALIHKLNCENAL